MKHPAVLARAGVMRRQLMTSISTRASTFVSNEEGATMVEYGLMLALIAVVCAIAVQTLGTNVSAKFTAAGDCVVNPGAGNCP